MYNKCSNAFKAPISTHISIQTLKISTYDGDNNSNGNFKNPQNVMEFIFMCHLRAFLSPDTCLIKQKETTRTNTHVAASVITATLFSLGILLRPGKGVRSTKVRVCSFAPLRLPVRIYIVTATCGQLQVFVR